MSSLVRRLQIRALKRTGYTRNKWIVGKDPASGGPKIINVRKGGEITDREDNPIGRQWPTVTALRHQNARSLVESRRPQRATRRSKRSQEWLEQRAKARGAQQ